ncbi:YfbU family protein [Chromobacterium vaccinii]|uniref:YfbU family protein n=1 Tax=Chromobacterium vaccinii TaxID=1108595 RepID=UPI0031D691DB
MEKNLELTDAQRLILANQYEILSRLDDSANADEYAEVAEQLRDGHAFLYDGFLDGVLSDVLDENTVDHVCTTLQLFSTLKDSYEKLSPEEKDTIDKKEVTFAGFDGNNETDMMLFAQALAKARRFSNTLGERGDLNSHSPTRDLYGRMIQAWKDLDKPHYPLTAEQIRQIVAARIHPSRR